MENVLNVKPERIQQEEHQRRVQIVGLENGQQQSPLRVLLVQQENIQHRQQHHHVKIVFQHVVEIVKQQQENAKAVLLDMDFPVEHALNVQQANLIQREQQKHVNRV